MSHGCAIGDVQGLLTITGLSPLVVSCACGRTRTDRTPTHMRAGLKSCGCKTKPRRTIDVGMEINGLRIISQHKYGQAIRKRSWNVECLRCLAVDAISEEWLIARAKRNAQGCRACNRFKRA